MFRLAALRRRVPAFRQMESTECGAACLAMVLAYHGRWEKIEAVRESCGVSRDGTSAAGIVEAAERHGLEAAAYQCDIAELSSLSLPQILFWGFDHFVVLEFIGRAGFVINDPAYGRRRVGREEFSKRFTGVTLTLKRGPGFTPAYRAPWAIGRFLGLLQGSGRVFAAIIAASSTMVLLAALIPGLTRIFVDDYLVEGNRDWLIPLLAAIIGIGALRSLLAALYTRGLVLLQGKITSVVTARFVWRLLHLPYEFFVRRSPVDVSSRTQYAGQLGGVTAGPLAQCAVNVLAMLGYAGVMLCYSAWLTAVCIAFAALDFAVLRLVARPIQEQATQLQIAQAQAHAASVRGAALLEQAKVSGGETQLFSQMLEAEVRFMNAEQGRSSMVNLLAALPYLTSRLTMLAVLGVGALLVITTEMTLGTLLGFLMLSALFSQATGVLTASAAAIGTAAAGADRLHDAFDYARADDIQDTTPQHSTGAIRLDGLGFSYGSGDPVLHGITLAVAPGECLAIMGASGAGKSTLARLLVGLATPSAGTLTFAMASGAAQPGCDAIGFVDQNPFLPNGTVRAALTLWDPTAPDDEIHAVLNDVLMAEAILGRGGGIDGPIGEGGTGFSGGERQRLAIARALIAAPRILVLDDATSALDEATEERLLENLRRRGLTVVLFTNRASAIQHCDRVCGLRDGRLLPIAMELANEYRPRQGAGA